MLSKKAYEFGPGIGSFLKLSYQSGPTMGSEADFCLSRGRYKPDFGIIGIKQVNSSYNLRSCKRLVLV